MSRFCRRYRVAVSIHAPVWGANSQSLGFLYQRFGFNPRTRVGCEPISFSFATSSGVSIHAPVWGANKRHDNHWVCCAFQSTHPCGVRNPQILKDNKEFVSIHAPVWGAKDAVKESTKEITSFNPRTRVGCEIQPYQRCQIQHVSIHAPVWGANSLSLN